MWRNYQEDPRNWGEIWTNGEKDPGLDHFASFPVVPKGITFSLILSHDLPFHFDLHIQLIGPSPELINRWKLCWFGGLLGGLGVIFWSLVANHRG